MKILFHHTENKKIFDELIQQEDNQNMFQPFLLVLDMNTLSEIKNSKIIQ